MTTRMFCFFLKTFFEALIICFSCSKLYADLFKISNNKMSEPLQEIMKVVTNNEEEKKKRENN